MRTIHALDLVVCVFLALMSPTKSIAQSPETPHIGTLSEELKATRDAGLPVYPKDLKGNQIPADQNAADLYRQLDQILSRAPLSKSEESALERLSDFHKPAPSEVAAVGRILMRRNDLTILIHQAAARPRCDFQRDWSLGAELTLPELSAMRAAARWLVAEAMLQLESGKALAAVKTLSLGFRLSRHASEDALLLGLLEGNAIDSTICRGLEKTLYRFGDNPEVSAAVQAGIAANWRPRNLRQAFKGELVTAVVNVEKVRKRGLGYIGIGTSGGAPIKTIKPGWPKWNSLIDSCGAFLIYYERQAALVLDGPYPEVRSLPLMKQLESISDSKDPAGMLAVVILPDVGAVARSKANNMARMEILKAAAAVLGYRARNGRLPESLSDAMKDPPRDPFDENELMYRVDGDGWVLYSVGEGGKFDGGSPSAKPPTGSRVFRYPLPGYLK